MAFELTFSDNFNRTNENPLGSPWSNMISGNPPEIVSNAITNVAGGTSGSMWYNGGSGNTVTNGAVEMTKTQLASGGSNFGLLYRKVDWYPTWANNDGYSVGWNYSAATITLSRQTNDSGTTLQTWTSQTLANGYKLRVEFIGDIHTVYKDTGGGWVSVGSYDTSGDPTRYLSAGAAGFYFDGGNSILDDFALYTADSTSLLTLLGVG